MTRIVLIMAICWGATSFYGITQLVTAQTQTFQSLVSSHQEDIISGQYRPFVEGLLRDPSYRFLDTEICWQRIGQSHCVAASRLTKPAGLLQKLFSHKITVPVIGQVDSTVTVDTLVPLVSALKMSLLVLLAFTASAIEFILAIRRTNWHAEQGRRILANAVLASLANPSGPGASELPDELRPIAVALSDSIAELHDTKSRHRAHQALNDLAAQVAHDVRSPLAALSAVVPDFHLLPEDSGALAKAAINRINEIANDLLRRYRDAGQSTKEARNSATPIFEGESRLESNVADIVDEIIQEKRLLSRSKPEIVITTAIAPAARGQVARVAPSDLRRTVSNLVNNSIEALGNRGVVHIQLQAHEDLLVLKISDNGRGVPADVLPKLGEKGFSFGKPAGSGLGLHHARWVVRQCGGDLSIASTQGQGTTVEALLPAAPTLRLTSSPASPA